MKKSSFWIYIYFTASLLIHISVLPIISINGVLPNLWIVLLVYFTLERTRLWGILTAAVFGLVIDLTCGNLIGASVFAASLAIYFGGFFWSEQRNKQILQNYSFILIVMLVTFIYSVVFAILTNLDIRGSIFSLVMMQGVFPSLYTAAISSFIVIVNSKRR